MKLTFAPSPKPTHYSVQDWSDWSWQLRHSLKNELQFADFFELTAAEKRVFGENAGGRQIFNVRATPYYASLAKNNPLDPIRRILVPHEKELFDPKQGMLDPLGEKKSLNNPVPRIIHRYSDRVLFLITDICSVYCRYCTRKHFTGSDQAFIKKSDYENALNYIQKATGIREVILSGGDPLTVSDEQLDRVLTDLRKIDHVEIIRIGTRMPVVAPMRITSDLVKIIQKAKPVFLMTHFNHPRELTAESAIAIENFVDHGIPVMNQMVLLNGVNNHPAIVQALSRRLLYLRAKPYYMFQCDPSIGTDHLRTTVEDSLEIQKELWGHLSGLAMPNLALDIPNGGGKVYYTPNFEKSVSLEKREYIGWDGVPAEYINPVAAEIIKPLDFELYQSEWLQLKSAKMTI
ncbi:MAG: lysine 2,3-aminomutase [Bdellovibrionales bacterium RIFCSPHIGHO2_01_FULL_40_29]|nr:MAG: lysine 2,3-aminomutase [Bdellovibrionales bacterium RIFCSPHIGHO2_01_FULL_40_29]OFZ32843.1 MAG: lysine 2,3-aminomutase [Bdellovibrionales bacterium RIFCSPHIGHO2_02_FULL_40_15]